MIDTLEQITFRAEYELLKGLRLCTSDNRILEVILENGMSVSECAERLRKLAYDLQHPKRQLDTWYYKGLEVFGVRVPDGVEGDLSERRLCRETKGAIEVEAIKANGEDITDMFTDEALDQIEAELLEEA